MNAMLKRYMHLGFSFSIGVYPGLRRRKAPQLESPEFESPTVDKFGSGMMLGDNQASLQVSRESQTTPQPPTISTFNGTVVRSGQRFAILLAGGALYQVDSTSRAWPFEGENVLVTGNLDVATRMIHIIAIQDASDPEIGSRMTA